MSGMNGVGPNLPKSDASHSSTGHSKGSSPSSGKNPIKVDHNAMVQAKNQMKYNKHGQGSLTIKPELLQPDSLNCFDYGKTCRLFTFNTEKGSSPNLTIYEINQNDELTKIREQKPDPNNKNKPKFPPRTEEPNAADARFVEEKLKTFKPENVEPVEVPLTLGEPLRKLLEYANGR